MQAADRYFVCKCLEGDHTAFGFLVDKYKAALYAFAYSRIHNFHDAEDITQKTFLKAYQNLRDLRHYDSFPAWLYSIASSLCKMHTRCQSRRPDKEYIEDQDYKELKNISMGLHREDMLYNSLHDALNSLPDKYQEVLSLYYLGGMDGKEIAEFLGISYSNVKQRLFRARTLLKEEMINIMETKLHEQRLGASFTFRIVETAKRIRINPTPKIASLPWGMASAISIIIAAFILNPYMPLNMLAAYKGWPLPAETKVLKTGEIPVDILKISNISAISSKQGDGNSGELVLSVQEDAPSNTQAEVDSWTRKADMPTPRTYISASALNGKIYAIGGVVDINVPTSVIEEYDTETDIWTRKSDMPVKHSYPNCVVDGKIFVIGAWDTLEYDPIKDRWKRKTKMPKERLVGPICAVNGKIYVIGGKSLDCDTFFSLVEEYDPVTDTWKTKADMPTARSNFAISVVNKKIYIIGGGNHSFGPNDMNGLSIVEEYDPATDTWMRKADMPTARWALSASVVNGKIYAIGGGKRQTPFKMVEEYDPDTNTWVKRADMPTARGALSTCVVDGKIYAIGGSSGKEKDEMFLSTVEVYDPVTSKKGFLNQSEKW